MKWHSVDETLADVGGSSPERSSRSTRRFCRTEKRLMRSRLLVSVVDDDESVRESLPCLLGELGLAARVFALAEQFLASGCIRFTRCLILDIALPGMSGSELHRELMLRGHSIPTIFITGQSDKTVRPGLLQQGRIECLFKPFSDDDLRATLDSMLDRG